MFSSGTMVLEAWNRANATSAVGSRSGIYQYQYSYTAAQSACVVHILYTIAVAPTDAS